MRIFGKTLTEFTATELQQLVADGQEETVRIDFKVDCYDFNDEETKKSKRIEFCKDVLALANASGGWIFCGIAETNGRASKLVGLENFNSDAEKRRLGQWLDNDAQPRIAQLNTHTITLSDGKSIFIIEVPRSFAAPHRNKQTNEFPLRLDARTEPNMTVDDLRRAFVGGATYADQIRAFRHERVAAILDPAHPKSLVPLKDGPLFVVHLLPIGMVEAPFRVSFSNFAFANNALWDTPNGEYFTRRPAFNLEGILLPIQSETTQPAMEYFQVFRSGAIEYVEANDYPLAEPTKPLSLHAFESRIILALAQCIRLQKNLDINEPNDVAVTVARTREFSWTTHMRTEAPNAWPETAPETRHDPLYFPEQYIESWDRGPTHIMKPIFDLWANALGWRASKSYDAQGNWIGDLHLPSIQ